MTMPPLPPGAGLPPGRQDPTPPPDVVTPPSNSLNRRRWILLVSVLLVVATLVVGFTVWKSTSLHGSDAWAARTTLDGLDRTVGLLREKDPVCGEWFKYADQLAVETHGWADIDDTIPASNWSPEQRELIETSAVAISAAADRFESILPMARYPVLQELIAQVIVYWRAYVNAIPTYVKVDGRLSGVASNFGGAVTFICTAVPLVPETGSDSERQSSAANPDKLKPFMTTADVRCGEFLALVERQNALLRAWADGDPTEPASEWSEEQRRLSAAVGEVLARDVEQVRNIAEGTVNPIFSDLLFTYSTYMKAFADVIHTYASDDDQIWRVAIYLAGGLGSACEAPT